MSYLHLLVLRHGKSDWATAATRDFDRPLKPRGERAARRMALFLREASLVPDQVVSSPAARAQATVAIVIETLALAPTQVVWEPAVYGASVATLLGCIAAHGGDHRRLLLVGHNPGLEELVSYLSPPAAFDGLSGKAFPTAALGILQIDGSWDRLGPGAASSAKVIRPRELD